MKTHFTPTFFLITVVFGLLATNFCFSDGFDLQDSNMDGVLSGREVGDLKLLDQDGDGEVSRQEFASAANEQRQRAATMVARIMKDKDGNGDGRLSGSEMSGLEYCDANQDRRITESELRAGLLSPDATLAGKSFSQIREIATDRFTKLDSNGDNRLTGTEAQGSMHFDQNADSRISREEYVVGVILSGASEAAGDEKPKLTDSPAPSPSMPEKPKLDSKWIETVSLENGVSFRMPGKAIYSERDNSPTYSFELPEKQMNFDLQIITWEPNYTKDSDAFFKLYRDTLVEKRGAKVLIEKSRTKDNFPENSLVLKSKNGRIVSMRSILDGNVNYHAIWSGPDLSDDSKDYAIDYMESIQLIDAKGAPRTGLKSNSQNEPAMPLALVAPVAPAAPVAPPGSNVLPLPIDPRPMVPELNDGWFQTVSIREGVKFRMPGESTRTEKKGEGNTVISYDLRVPEKKLSFQLVVSTLEGDLSKESDAFFNTFKNGLLKGTRGELLDEKIDAKAGFPRQVLSIKSPDGRVLGTLMMVDGNSVYRAQWDGPKVNKEDLGMGRKFFESIVLIDAGGATRTGADPINPVAPPPFPTTPPLPAPPAPR